MEKKYTDLSYLKEIANGSQTFMTEMIEAFNRTAPEMVSEMDKNLNAGNWDGIKVLAHKLRPGISMMGIKDLEQDILTIESNASKRTDLEDLPELINRLRVIILLSISELEGSH